MAAIIPFTEGEQRQLSGIAAKLHEIKGFFASHSLPPADFHASEWYTFLVGLKVTLGNFNNDVSFVGVLLAKEFLARRHHFQDFDVSRKPQGAGGLDIDETTMAGERVVGEVKTTIPYGGKELGAAQKTAMRKDFVKLGEAKADHRYFFVTDERTFNVVKRRHAKDLKEVILVLLPQGLHDQKYVAAP